LLQFVVYNFHHGYYGHDALVASVETGLVELVI
jgi:hypothetical protein